MDADGPAGLRVRTRRAVRAQITGVALRLFIEHGFDAVTMDQIAAEAGLSRRSLFRYFGSKEDVVLGDLVEAGLSVRAALRRRPTEEAPWPALRAALESLAAEPGRSLDRDLAVTRMLHATPSLRARHYEKQMRWQELLVPEVSQRLGPTAPRLAAEAIVACALTCLDVASRAWVDSGGAADLGGLFDEAAAAMTAALPARPAKTGDRR